MPNHVKNLVRFEGDQKEIDRLKSEVATDEGWFTFDNVIPMPKDLHVASDTFNRLLEDPRGDEVKEAFPRNFDAERIWEFIARADDEQFERIIQGMRNRRVHGHSSWYGWAVENWGTKWDAYQCEEREGWDFVFETAWSIPEPVYLAMSKAFPTVLIHVEFADEDKGSNCGVRQYRDGVCVNSVTPKKGEAAERFAVETVWGFDWQEWRQEVYA